MHETDEREIEARLECRFFWQFLWKSKCLVKFLRDFSEIPTFQTEVRPQIRRCWTPFFVLFSRRKDWTAEGPRTRPSSLSRSANVETTPLPAFTFSASWPLGCWSRSSSTTHRPFLWCLWSFDLMWFDFVLCKAGHPFWRKKKINFRHQRAETIFCGFLFSLIVVIIILYGMVWTGTSATTSKQIKIEVKSNPRLA